jgi:hypothetical protein
LVLIKFYFTVALPSRLCGIRPSRLDGPVFNRWKPVGQTGKDACATAIPVRTVF